MKKSVLSIYVLLLVLLIMLIPESYGQESDSLKYKISLQISGQRKTGVFSQRSLRVSATNELEKRKWKLKNISGYAYTNVNTMTIANDWDFRSILMYKFNEDSRIFPAVAHNYHSNVLYRIENSNRGIAGVRAIPIKKIPEFTIYIGAGYESTNYTGENFENSSLISDHRSFALGFANLSGKHVLGENKISWHYNLSLVQSMAEAEDYFVWFTTGISLPVGKVLSVGIDYDIRYRNVHLEGIPQTNDLLLVNLKAKLSGG